MAQPYQKMAASSFINSDEAMDIISTIRALTVSQKEMTSEQDLMRDYKQLNGEMVPYKKFGFNSLEQFLMASCEFMIRRNAQGGISVSAKPSKESSHIVDLIQKQKSSTTGKKKRLGGGGFRRPLSADQSWHKTQYSSAFSKLPSPKKSLQSIMQRNNHHRSSSNPPRSLNNNTNIIQNRNFPATNKENLDNFELMTTQNIKVQDVRAKGREHLIKDTKKIDKPLVVSRQNSREQSYQQKVTVPSQPQYQQEKQKDAPKSRSPVNNTHSSSIGHKSPPQAKNSNHISLNNSSNKFNNGTAIGSVNNKQLDDSNRNKLQSRIDMANAIAKHQEPPTDPNKKITIKNDYTKNIPPLMSLQVTIPTHNHSAVMLKSSLQDRLIVKKPLQLQPFDNSGQRATATSPTIKTPTTPTNSQPAPVFISSPPILANLETPSQNMTPTEELEYYCQTHNYPKPIYSTMKLFKSNRLHCKVFVNDVAYTTYPEDFANEHDAQSTNARNALKQLKSDEMRQMYPVCSESDFNVAIKIYNKLKEYPHGVFSKNFPEMFQETYERMLPDKWFSIVVSSPQLFSVEESTAGTYILFALVCESDSGSVSATSDSDNRTTLNEKLVMPWHLEHWDLYITNPVSTIQVWARIIGEEYSEKMDSLSNDIDMAMLTDKQRAQTIQIGYIYLVSVSDCWYRVKANQLDFEKNTCMCFFIDVGEEEWYSMEQLFVCDVRFMKFPAQAIPFSLFGLEDFDENPHAKNELVNLAGRTVIAKVFTKQEEYEMHEESSNFDARIKIVLYDTSSDDDLNLNPLILQKICENTPPPQFGRAGFTHVNITYISGNGEMFCQIKDSGIYYIEKLINNLIESKLNEEIHSGLYQQDKKSSVKQYYLIFDEGDKKWYRAIIESFTNVEDEYKLFYVDYGITRVVKTKRILRTDSLSAALHRFPQQAVRIRLAGIQHINENTVARLRGLLKPGTSAIIKIMSLATIPLVNVYTRLQPGNVLLCVNETIRLEQEMEQSSELNQNIANLKLNLSTSTNSTTITSSSAYRSPQTIGSNSSLSSSKTSLSKNGGNTSPGNSPESLSSLNDLSSQFKSIDIKSQSTPGGGKLDLSKIKPAVLPPIGQLTYVRISMASNPSYFVIQPNQDAEKLHALMTELQTYCINNKEFIPSDCVQVGEVYGALHMDGNWYRATVENIYEPSMIHIYYCDFGDVAVLSSDKLKILPFQFRTLPRQATKAKLYGIKPKFRDWGMTDCLYFQELTVNKVFASTIRSIEEDEISKEAILELILVDVSGSTDISIHELLIKENRAVAC